MIRVNDHSHNHRFGVDRRLDVSEVQYGNPSATNDCAGSATWAVEAVLPNTGSDAFLLSLKIPGTTKLQRLDENLGAAKVELTTDDLQGIEDAASKITIQGARLSEAVLKMSEC